MSNYYSVFNDNSFFGDTVNSNNVITGLLSGERITLTDPSNQFTVNTTTIDIQGNSERTITIPDSSDADVVLTEEDQIINGEKSFMNTMNSSNITPLVNSTFSLGNAGSIYDSSYVNKSYVNNIVPLSGSSNLTIGKLDGSDFDLIFNKSGLTSNKLLKLDNDNKLISDTNDYLPKNNPTYTGTLTTPLSAGIAQINVSNELISSNNLNNPSITLTDINKLLRTDGSGLVYGSNTLPDNCSANNFTVTNPHINFVTTNSVLMTNGSGYAYTSNTLPDISVGTVLPTFTSNNLGGVSNRWNYLYVKSGDFYSIDSGNILPSLGLTYDLGSSGKLWNNVYADIVNANTINVNSINITGSIVPTADNTYDFGAGSFRWRTIYIYDIRMLGKIGSNFVPNGNRNLGDSTARWNNFYANNSDINTLVVNTGVGSALIPSTNTTYDLGSSSYKWNNAYINTVNTNSLVVNTNVSSSLTPSATSTYNLGTNSLKWNNVYANNLYGSWTPSGHLIPSANNTYNLGSPSFKWTNVYASNFYGNWSPTGSLLPPTNNTYDLGSSSYKWANLYITQINANNILATNALSLDRSTETAVTSSLNIYAGTSGGATTGNHAKVALAIKGGGGGNVFAGMDLGYYDGALPLIITSTGGDTVFACTISPYTDNVYSCGKSGKRWSYIWTGYGVLQTSDGNDKENICDCDLGLDFINDLKPKKYNWKSEKKESNYGIVAQDLEETLNKYNKSDFSGLHKPVDDGDKYGINYSQLIPVLIKAVQELTQKVNELEDKLNNK